ncbi:MAG: ParB N-terminal domain-containing protein [Sulfitobacter sp.]
MNDRSPVTADLTLIPLADLSISPLNTRQDVPAPDIEAMAQSICVNGLMQNLMAHRTDDGIGVVAGGKRLRALQLIAANPEQFEHKHPINTVPVRITEDAATARDWAGAENEARSDPHPADQIIAYRDMAATGATAATIARAYAKNTAHVNSRLRLAELPDSAIAALRNGQINLDEAKALTLTNDTAKLDRVLEVVTTHPPHDTIAYIRRELSDGKIAATDRRVVFVGLDTYVAEGGKLTPDLFEGRSLLHDESLLNKLFATKLAIKAEEVEREEGWAWVKPVHEPHLPYSRHEEFTCIYPEPGELSAADQEEYERLEETLQTDQETEGDLARLDELQSRLDGDFTDMQRETAGVFLTVDHKGQLEIHRAYTDRNKSGDAGETTLDGDEITKEITPPKPPITAKGTDDLHTIATLALQTAMLTKPDLLLDLLAFQFEADLYAWDAPMNIQRTEQKIAPSEPAGITTTAQLSAKTEITGPTPVEQFAAFQAMGKKHRNTVLSRNLARAINAPMHRDFGRHIMAEADAKMRKVWTPTAANFFSSCSVAMLDGLWAQLLELEDDDVRRGEFARLKKGEKAKQLEALMSDASVQEAHGLSRAQIKALDAWVPDGFEVT